MQCPECKHELGNRALSCGCGWKKRTVQYSGPVHDARCAHDDCGISAMYKIKMKTGWANLCWQHYDAHFAHEAQANLAKWGLERSNVETQWQHVKRMRNFVKKAFNGLSSKSRNQVPT